MRKVKKNDVLVKIGKLAKEAHILSSAIRYYTDFGLLRVDSYTKGGHRLYRREETLAKLKIIKMVTGKTHVGTKETLLKLLKHWG